MSRVLHRSIYVPLLDSFLSQGRLTTPRQILLTSDIILFIGILFSFNLFVPYTVHNLWSSVNLSLLSRVMSSRLSKGTYNRVLLSTEAGTLARVVADATITLGGYLGRNHLLNATLLPSLGICIGSIVATYCTYNSLY
ncbi:hypothetical protein BRARA_G00494 [Brassica rapa]|uniref:Uncharacterized protein n=1 Tax=Brassica campestris TaxID=3711 RepID=A0A397YHY7_BRACM|nr:hypothetical protein BRARA_G00494 [Brassica rapa]